MNSLVSAGIMCTNYIEMQCVDNAVVCDVNCKKLISRARFNVKEDEIIKHCVEEYGSQWLEYAVKCLGHKHSERAIRERYKNYIDSKQKRSFTTEEDKIIFNSKMEGKSFKEIARIIGNTSAQHIRIRFNKIQRKRGTIFKQKKSIEAQIEFSKTAFEGDEIDFNELFKDFLDEINFDV